MNRRKTHIIILIVLLAITFSTLYILLQNGTNRIKKEVDYAFKEAIVKDYQARLSYITYYHPEPVNWYLKYFMAAPALEGKVKEYTVKTRKGNVIYTFKDSLEEHSAKRFLNQYLLSQLKPINANELNHVFQQVLSQHGITGKSGVAYHFKGTSQFSNNDSIAPPSAYSTPRYIADITFNVKLQAWADYDFKTLWSHMDSTILWFVCELFIIIALFFFYRKESNRRKANNSNQAGIVIDLEKQELTINGISCAIQKLDLTLLNLFFRRMNECVDREEIKQMFWSTDENANEKIDAHIKAIRKVLKDFPEYRLVTVRGKGYYLTR